MNLIVPIVVVYKNPSDYPDKYVARLWNMDKPTAFAVIDNTLEEVRNAIPQQFTNIGRDAADDPAIVEVWI